MPTTYAIPDGRTVMAATTYTGTGAALTVSNAVNGVSFQPDLVWVKSRSGVTSHTLIDSVRGVQKWIGSNSTSAEQTYAGTVDAFTSSGFTVGSDAWTGAGGSTYVGWNWKANGAAVTNTSGSISSQVSANTTAGFSVVTYTGNGTSGATVGHGLSTTPQMIIIKGRNAAGNWQVYHQAIGNTGIVCLDLTIATYTTALAWNNTSPTSSVFTLGSGGDLNGSAKTYVAYCWAAVPGYSAFGSYTGNGSSDGPFVYLGFRPRWIMIKNITAASAGSWRIYDTSRATYNADGTLLWADLASAEVTDAAYQLDHVSNGFKIRNTSSDFNASSNTYIYACFAENPFKYANAR